QRILYLKKEKQNICLINQQILELKRFLLLKALVPSLEMYSPSIDNLWHESILFTKNYNEFCHKLKGDFIHHNPNLHSTVNIIGRYWFDWLYLFLFKPNQIGWKSWNGFMLQKLSESQIKASSYNLILEIKNTNLKGDQKYHLTEISKLLIEKLKDSNSEMSIN
ncbi:hypothetical protein ACEF17_12555, partial [Streptococcus hyovaginalis]